MSEDEEKVEKQNKLFQSPPRRRMRPNEASSSADASVETNWRSTSGQKLRSLYNHQRNRQDAYLNSKDKKQLLPGPFHQRPNNNNYHRSKRAHIAPSPFSEFLQDMQHEKANKIVFKLAERRVDLDKFIKSRIDLKEFQLLLRVLRKICHSNFDQNKALVITVVCQQEFLVRFPTILVQASSESDTSGASVIELATDMVHFFATLTTMLPLTAVDLKSTVQSCLSSLQGLSAQGDSEVVVYEKLFEQFKDVLGDLEVLQVSAPKSNTRWLTRRKQLAEKQKFEQPPNNFREISIYPNSEEVLCTEAPFLRPNIVDGPYSDVEHYLDIQFRLLREDFVRPLREGIQDIINNTNSRKCESLSVKIYRDVQFLSYERVRKGDSKRVAHEGIKLCFDITGKRYERINWRHSKRFLYGALLCFTSDNFETLIFATVSSRDLEYLNQCQLLVKFCEHYVEENVFDPHKKYIMIESDVFFEPYFRVLTTLKNFNELNFPMARYLISLEEEDNYPKFLTHLKVVGNQQNNLLGEDAVVPGSVEEDVYISRDTPVKVNAQGKDGQDLNFTILEEDTWPDADELGLDSSQYRALQAALTKELVVIQGPPGTGKTFMALKIAEILVKNKEQMGRSTPILVVCLTNHALDQFLVGMLSFTDKVVRIGGRSKREELAYKNLRNIAFKWRTEEQQAMLWEQRSERDSLNQQQDEVERSLYAVEKGLKSKDGFVITGIELEGVPLLQHELVCGYLTWFLGKEKGYITFKKLHADITDWKKEETKKITSEKKLTAAEAASLEVVTNQCAYYLLAELDFLESHFWSYERCAAPPPSVNGKRAFQLSMDEKLDQYFQSLEAAKKVLVNHRLKLMEKAMKVSQILDELQYMEHIKLLEDQDVIGLTTTGAARLHTMLRVIGCQIVLVEEAAEVMESHIVASLSANCQQLILIGDHKQLRPTISVYELGKHFNFDISLFERMVKNRRGCVTLQVQHRMCPEMAHLIVPSIYKTLENHNSVLDRGALKSLPKRLFFKTHSEPEVKDRESASRTNEFEADYLIALCQHLLQQGYDPLEITVLTTYTGQMFMIKRKIQEISDDQLQIVHVTVVDNFQGEENKIILLSLVRSNSEGRIGFLATENRVCVALSRARDGFFIVGNMDILAATNPTWIAVKKALEKQGAIGPAIPLRCQVHPDQTFDFASPGDPLENASKGGCSLICEDILECGHKCDKICHLMVEDHSNVCLAPCSKLCNAGIHTCKKKCFDECGPNCAETVVKQLPCGHSATTLCCTSPEQIYCLQEVEKYFPLCQHEVIVPCSSNKCSSICISQVSCGHSCLQFCHLDDDPDHMKYICQKPCGELKKDCSADHPCTKMCFEECDLCDEKVEKKLNCGHTLQVSCHEDPEKILCREKCGKLLSCGHVCPFMCRLGCYPCTQLVDKVVPVCGHTAKVPCGRDPVMADCLEACERNLPGCEHLCKAMCAEECTLNCSEVVGSQKSSCGHVVDLVCFESRKGIVADFLRCNAACDAILACGHKCEGTCKSCHQGQFHVLCKEKSPRQLVCGHTALYECSDLNPPQCNAEISLICEHDIMAVKCGISVFHKCKKKCNYGCEHSKCTKLCGMACNRDPCEETCKEKLPCGHNCIGFCGELCPNLCWECNRSELEASAFPADIMIVDQETPPKFVLLPDCKHIFEAAALTNWFEWQNQNVEALSCPQCETAITLKLRRFRKSVLMVFNSWSKIRNKIELNKTCSAHDLIMVVEAIQICFNRSFRTGYGDLERYLTKLIKKLTPFSVSKRDSNGNQQPCRGSTGLLHLFKQIAVLVELAILFSNGNKPISYTPKLERKVAFLVSVLRGGTTFSPQQIIDLKKLLASVSALTKDTMGSAADHRRESFWFHPHRKERAVDMSLPLQQLKTHWQMCMTCGELMFGVKEENTKCSLEGCDALLTKPVFGFP